MKKFQENLILYRKKKYKSGKLFAHDLGIKYTTYMNYELKGCEPNYDTLNRIASLLDVSIDELLGYESLQNQEQRYKAKYLELLKRINKINVISDIGGNL